MTPGRRVVGGTSNGTGHRVGRTPGRRVVGGTSNGTGHGVGVDRRANRTRGAGVGRYAKGDEVLESAGPPTGHEGLEWNPQVDWRRQEMQQKTSK